VPELEECPLSFRLLCEELALFTSVLSDVNSNHCGNIGPSLTALGNAQKFTNGIIYLQETLPIFLVVLFPLPEDAGIQCHTQ